MIPEVPGPAPVPGGQPPAGELSLQPDGRLSPRIESVLKGRMLVTVFQPIHDLAVGGVIGAEALTRFVGEDVAFLHAGGDQGVELKLGVLAGSTDARIAQLSHSAILTRKVPGMPSLRRFMVRRVSETSAGPAFSAAWPAHPAVVPCLGKLLYSETAASELAAAVLLSAVQDASRSAPSVCKGRSLGCASAPGPSSRAGW